MKSKNKLVPWAIICFLLTIPHVSAHSPTSVDLSYEFDTKLLKVSISHSVSDPSTHYIESIEIYINSILNQSNSYSNQPTSNQFSYNYQLNVSVGDEISVKVVCSISGSREKIITIEEDEETSTTETNTSSSDTNIISDTDEDSKSISGTSTILVYGLMIFGLTSIFQSKKKKR